MIDGLRLFILTRESNRGLIAIGVVEKKTCCQKGPTAASDLSLERWPHVGCQLLTKWSQLVASAPLSGTQLGC
jgi:hypothetical protein